jgi:hypothetical protein
MCIKYDVYTQLRKDRFSIQRQTDSNNVRFDYMLMCDVTSGRLTV